MNGGPPSVYKSLLDEKYKVEYKLDRHTRAKALEILSDYFRRNPDELTESSGGGTPEMHATVRAAILVASKCPQESGSLRHSNYNTQNHENSNPFGNGQPVRTIKDIPTSFFLQSLPTVSLEDFKQKLDAVLQHAKVEYDVLQASTNIQNRLAISLHIYDKFTKMWDGFGVKDRSLNVACAQQIKQFAWHLFIIAKIRLLDHGAKANGREDFIEMCFLLYAVFYHVLLLLPLGQVSCDLVDKCMESKKKEEEKQIPQNTTNNDNQSDQIAGGDGNARVNKAIKEHLKGILKMQEPIDAVEIVEGQVKALLEKLREKGRLVTYRPVKSPSDQDPSTNPEQQQMTNISGAGQQMQQQPSTTSLAESQPHGNNSCVGNTANNQISLDPQIIQANNQEQLQSDLSCLHGLLDPTCPNSSDLNSQPANASFNQQSKLAKNLQSLNSYYAKQLTSDCDFDERYFIDQYKCGNKLKTAAKLISPISFSKDQTSSNNNITLPSQVYLQGPPPVSHKKPIVSEQIKRAKGDGTDAQGNQIEYAKPVANNANNPAAGQMFMSRGSHMEQHQKILGRVLDFNNIQQPYKNMTLQETLATQPFPNYVLQTPSSMYERPKNNAGINGQGGMAPQQLMTQQPNQQSSLQLQQQSASAYPTATPISLMMEVRRWITELSQSVKISPKTQFILFPDLTLPFTDEKASQIGQEIRQMIKNFSFNHQSQESGVYQLTCALIQQLVQLEILKQKQRNMSSANSMQLINSMVFIKSMIVYATELHLFSATSSNTLALPDTLKLLQLDAFDLWRTFESFLTFDSSMPRKVREHFSVLERHIVQYLSWLPDTDVPKKVTSILKSQQEGDKETAGMRTLTEDARRDEQEARVMKTYNIFFGRVLHLAAQTIQELSQYLGIDQATTEIIWSVTKVALAQESDLLVGRHLDQIVICTIYGVCRVHPNCTAASSQTQSNNNNQLQNRSDQLSLSGQQSQANRQILFNDLIEAYKEVSKARISQVGRKLPGIAKPSTSTGTNVNWVFIDVLIDSWSGQKDDIIKFYNRVYLERMKEYIFTTRNMKLELQNGNRTPQLTRSNFDALLTPGGRAQKPGIQGLCPLTPLIDQLENQKQRQRSYFSYKPSQNQQHPSQTPNPYSHLNQVPIGARSVRSQILHANESTSGQINQITSMNNNSLLHVQHQSSSGRTGASNAFKNFHAMISTKKPSVQQNQMRPMEPSLMNQQRTVSPTSQQSSLNQVQTPHLGGGANPGIPSMSDNQTTNTTGPLAMAQREVPKEPALIDKQSEQGSKDYFSMGRSHSFMPMPNPGNKQNTSKGAAGTGMTSKVETPQIEINPQVLGVITEEGQQEDQKDEEDDKNVDDNNNQKDL